MAVQLLGVDPASADGDTYSLSISTSPSLGANVNFCIKSESSATWRVCKELNSGAVNTSGTVVLDRYKKGEQVYLDWEVYGEHTHNDKLITGATSCTVSGSLLEPVMTCNTGDAPQGNVYTVSVDNKMGADVEFCLKTRASGVVRDCSGRLNAGKGTTLSIAYQPGDVVLLDFEIFGDHDYHDGVITGGHNCVAEGIINFAKVDCHAPHQSNDAGQSFSPVEIPPYSLQANDTGNNVMDVLGLLAWCVSAAGVAGIIITGTNMAVQLRRGDPGEFSEHWRSMTLVILSCIVGATAGPIISYLHII